MNFIIRLFSKPLTYIADRLQVKAMNSYIETHNCLEDGAFFAIAENDYGWDAEDWLWYEDNK